MPTNASPNKCKKTHQNNLFDDGAVTKFGLRNKYMDRYLLLTDDIYDGAIPEESKGKLFKYKVTGFMRSNRNSLWYNQHKPLSRIDLYGLIFRR